MVSILLLFIDFKIISWRKTFMKKNNKCFVRRMEKDNYNCVINSLNVFLDIFYTWNIKYVILVAVKGEEILYVESILSDI